MKFIQYIIAAIAGFVLCVLITGIFSGGEAYVFDKFKTFNWVLWYSWHTLWVLIGIRVAHEE